MMRAPRSWPMRIRGCLVPGLKGRMVERAVRMERARGRLLKLLVEMEEWVEEP